MPDKQKFDAASVAIFRKREVLLIQRARAPYKTYWTLPGGRIDAGETPKECAQREVDEELGLAVSPKFVCRHVVSAHGGQFALAVFVADFEGDMVRTNQEVLDWRWVGFDDLDMLKTTPELVRIVDQASRAITAD